MKKLFYLTAAAVFFVGCATQRNAEKFFAKTPGYLAGKCAAEFPILDSVGRPDTTYRPADNRDYSRELDSLSSRGDALSALATRLAQALADAPGPCLDAVADLNREADSLRGRIKRLQANYRPCLPDTQIVEIPIWQRDTRIESSQAAKIRELEKNLAKTMADRDEWKTKAQKRWWLLLVAGLVLVILVILKIKRVL